MRDKTEADASATRTADRNCVAMAGESNSTESSSSEFTLLLEGDGVTKIWKRYRRWSQVAGKQKKRLDRWRRIELYLASAGAALTTGASQIGEWGWVAALVGSVCLAAAPLTRKTFLGADQVSAWTRSRVVVELLKREFYLFGSAVRPYDKGSDEDRFQKLLKNVGEITHSVEDLRSLYALEIADKKPMPLKLDRQGYIDTRLNGQYRYFRSKAKTHAEEGNRLTYIVYTLSSIAALIGFLSGSVGGASVTVDGGGARNKFVAFVSGGLGAWAAVFTTAAAAVSGHIAHTKHHEVSAMYSVTAQRLEDLSLEVRDTAKTGTEEWSDFVLNCEAEISQENAKWTAINTKSKKIAEQGENREGNGH
jgi:hypothetical protein